MKYTESILYQFIPLYHYWYQMGHAYFCIIWQRTEWPLAGWLYSVHVIFMPVLFQRTIMIVGFQVMRELYCYWFDYQRNLLLGRWFYLQLEIKVMTNIRPSDIRMFSSKVIVRPQEDRNPQILLTHYTLMYCFGPTQLSHIAKNHSKS